jgi:hypothetical protein
MLVLRWLLQPLVLDAPTHHLRQRPASDHAQGSEQPPDRTRMMLLADVAVYGNDGRHKVIVP